MKCRSLACRRLLFGLACVVGLEGCFSGFEPQIDVQDELVRGRVGKALDRLDQADEVDPVLKLLEKAQLEHYAGRWQESNSSFDQAEKLIVELYDQSLENGGPDLIINDDTKPYRVEPFEIAMVPYYRAFNSLALGDQTAARDEAARASRLIARSVDLMFRTTEVDTLAAVDILRRSAFAHYLAGLLSESSGADDEAFVEYRQALIAYHDAWSTMRVPIPVWLGGDLARVGEPLGYWTELEEVEREYPGLFTVDGPPGGPGDEAGTLALFVEVGWVAGKQADTIAVPILQTDDTTNVARWAEAAAARLKPGWSSWTPVRAEVSVTLPVLVPFWAGAPTSVDLEVKGKEESVTVSSAVVEDLEQRAELTFTARDPTVLRKTIEKALGEYLEFITSRQEDRRSGMIKFRSQLSEETADTRSWVTLPKAIALIRIDLPPGVYELELEFRDAWGTVVSRETMVDVEITAGEFSFFNRRVF